MKQDDYPVAVYCLNPRYDIDNDYRLNFLKKQGVIVESIYDAFDQELNALHRSLRFLFLWFFAQGRKLSSHHQDTALPLSRLSQLATEIMGRMFYELARLGFYHTKWAHYVLEQSEAQALCFDHILPRRYVVGALLKAAKEISVPTLALPHGVYLYTNESYKARTSSGQRFYKFNRFDYVIVQNHLRKDVLVSSGIAREKIIVLGSARFCGEWIAQNKKILPRMIESAGRDLERLRVVFMPSKPRCRIDVERMHNTIDLLASLSEIEAVVKPHTRIGREAHLFDNMQLPNVSHVLTSELCEWADVVLIIGSSVITEALMQGKPVLYLKYLHANTMLFEECGACWTIHDEAELGHALQSLRLNKTDVPYQDQNVKKFLSEVVYGGRNERDVLKDYVQFITNCATN
ncbi:MAG: hypothetical protein GWN86_13055 [Desulfobacterales bacterium]|nr:hypothetical protein [Deltaproteobacteria bacterium]NIR14815.1 hypothetical protein [Desulfobacterales bacterium]